MKEKIKTFLVLYLVFWIALSLIAYKPEKGVGFLTSILIAGVGSIIIAAIFVYTIYYSFPKEMEAIFKRKTYQTLMQNGFVRDGYTLIGLVKNYTVIVDYSIKNFRSRPALSVTVLFDPLSWGYLPNEEEFKTLLKRNDEEIIFGKQNQWTFDSISYNVLFGLIRQPSYEKLMAKAEKLVGVLIRNKLKPISLQRLNEITPEIQQHYISQTNNNKQ
jgi:hypothetical protein